MLKNGRQRSQIIVLDQGYVYLDKRETKGKQYYTENKVIVDNIFFEFGGNIFQQITGILVGTEYVLLTNLFLYSYESEFTQKQRQNNTEGKAFNLTFRYNDDVLSINNPDFANGMP